jgi:hypothetical protein
MCYTRASTSFAWKEGRKEIKECERQGNIKRNIGVVLTFYKKKFGTSTGNIPE